MTEVIARLSSTNVAPSIRKGLNSKKLLRCDPPMLDEASPRFKRGSIR
jgi:hypothetical protein